MITLDGPPLKVDGQHRIYYSTLARERRRTTVWIAATWLIGAVLFSVGLYSLPSGNKWDRAVAIGTCGGLPIVRQEDGSTWLRVSSVRVYRVEDPTKLTCG